MSSPATTFRHRVTAVAVAVSLAAPLVASTALPATAHAAASHLSAASGPTRRYIVTTASATTAYSLAYEVRQAGGVVADVYTEAITGLAASLTEQQASELRADPRVTAVEIDEIVEADGLDTTYAPATSPAVDPVAGDIIPGRYIIRIKSSASLAARDNIATILGDSVVYTYGAVFSGYAADLTPQQLKLLKSNTSIATIEPDRVVTATADQTNPPWGLDRIDQPSLPLNGHYIDRNDGDGVKAYVIDSGIAAHTDFGSRLATGRNFVSSTNGNSNTTDCNGHGTHVAGTIAGTTYGVAKAATLVPVRVLDCNGSGSNSNVIKGLDWVKSDHSSGPAVVNMSLGGSASATLNASVQSVIDDGVIVVVAAGNNGLDACNYSPASAPNAVTVGASTNTDGAASFSNTGTCLDMFAPGQSILSTWLNGGTNTISGTSMASPHVAGAAAVLWGASPTANAPAITASLLASTSNGKLALASTDTTSPNKLLYVNPGTGTAPGTPTGLVVNAGSSSGSAVATWSAPTQTGSSPINGYTVTSTPGGNTCIWVTGPLTCTLSGLAPGTYSFTVRASNIWGNSPESTASTGVAISGTNDYFSYATVISTNTAFSGTLNDSNSSATTEVNEPLITGVGAGGGATMWYRYTASEGGPFTVSTNGSSFDTIVDIFSTPASPATPSLSNLTNIANNDDFGGALTSSVTVAVTSGAVYYVRVSSWGAARGSLKLNWNLSPVCPTGNDQFGDFFCHARTRVPYGELLSVDTSQIPAGFEVGEPAPRIGASDSSIWYRWTAPDNGTLSLSVGSFVAPNIATVLGVFTGSSLTTLVRPTGWTDVGGTTTYSATLTVIKDVVYYWRQTTFVAGQSGWFDLTHSFIATPVTNPPDAPATASVKASTTDGTIDITWTASPNDGGLPISAYSATVAETGATCQTDVSGRSCSIANLTNYSLYTVSVYAINAAGSSPARSAGTVRPGMAHDMFAAPKLLSGSSGTIADRNTFATMESGEPRHAGTTPSHSMWFTYTPINNGQLTINTLGSSFDTVLAVYTGPSLVALTSVASNDDIKTGTTSEVSFSATTGTTYRIAVDGYSNAYGNFSLNWSLVQPAPPPPPTGVKAATSRPRQVEISWVAPVSTTYPVIDYLVTSSPGGQMCTWTSGPLTCIINNLSPSTSYTFTVKARNAIGFSLPSAPSNAVTPRTLTHVTTTANSWGVDRIDQTNLPLDDTFTTSNRGEGAVVFVVDTGIYAAHHEFAGRIAVGRNFTSNDALDTEDCQGHGTHVASTAVGTDYGVATSATVVPVRVLDCSGSGYTSWIISGLDYIASYPLNGRRAVVNMSLGGGASQSLNAAVARLVSANIIVVAAAGNDSALACDGSPAQEPSAITVAATDSTDTRAWFSNYGSCVDLFAPGFDIVGAAITGATASTHKSGTSMATPHVAGAAAIMATAWPSTSAASIANLIIGDATPNLVSDAGDGSPNRLLMVTGTSLPVDTVPVTLKTVSPTRLFDTRTGVGGVPVQKVGGQYELQVQVTGRNGVPLIGASAVSLNVTVTDAAGWGYITVYPCGTRPNASSLNYEAGSTIANAVVAPLSSDGRLCFYSYSPVNLIADVNGTLLDGNGFEALSPTRLFDTRTGEGGVAANPVGGAYVLEVPVNGRASVPSTGVGAVVMNVTATDTSGRGYVTVFPCGTLPNSSNINFTPNETVPNAVVAPLSSSGSVCFYVYGGAHLIADVTGYFTANVGFVPLSPTRLEDTRSYGTFGVVGNDAGTGAPLRVTVLGRAGIPYNNVAAVSLNVTAIGADTRVGGYVTVYPCGEPPNASNINFVADEVVPNAVIAPVSSSGEVCVFVYGRAHILVDVSGYITSTL